MNQVVISIRRHFLISRHSSPARHVMNFTLAFHIISNRRHLTTSVFAGTSHHQCALHTGASHHQCLPACHIISTYSSPAHHTNSMHSSPALHNISIRKVGMTTITSSYRTPHRHFTICTPHRHYTSTVIRRHFPSTISMHSSSALHTSAIEE